MSEEGKKMNFLITDFQSLEIFFEEKVIFFFAVLKKSRTFAPAFEKQREFFHIKDANGPVVQFG